MPATGCRSKQITKTLNGGIPFVFDIAAQRKYVTSICLQQLSYAVTEEKSLLTGDSRRPEKHTNLMTPHYVWRNLIECPTARPYTISPVPIRNASVYKLMHHSAYKSSQTGVPEIARACWIEDSLRLNIEMYFRLRREQTLKREMHIRPYTS